MGEGEGAHACDEEHQKEEEGSLQAAESGNGSTEDAGKDVLSLGGWGHDDDW
jgi:hypothetical protein